MKVINKKIYLFELKANKNDLKEIFNVIPVSEKIK